MLKRNLKYLRKAKNISQKQIGILLGISRSTYGHYETGKSEPTASILLKLSKYYKLTVNDLLTKNIGSPLFNPDSLLEDNITSKNIRILPITISNAQEQNITTVEFVPVKAMAGYSINIQEEAFISNLPKFQIPKLSRGNYRAFEIEGDSMPPIEEGYIVIGKYIEHVNDIKNGKRYVLVLRNEGVVFKRVTNEFEQNKKLILVSDNSEYTPFTTNVIDILEAWEFVAFIGFPSKIDMNYVILDKLHEMEQKINHLISNS